MNLQFCFFNSNYCNLIAHSFWCSDCSRFVEWELLQPAVSFFPFYWDTIHHFRIFRGFEYVDSLYYAPIAIIKLQNIYNTPKRNSTLVSPISFSPFLATTDLTTDLPVLDSLHRWAHPTCGLCVSGFFHSSTFSKFIHVVTLYCSFLWLNDVPLHGRPYFIHS